ncbi:MAG: ComF family protein [Dehalococcoidia bacterium]
MAISNIYRAALDLLYPPRCLGCGAFGTFLCPPCDGAMGPTSVGDRCPNCTARWSGGLNCPRCFSCEALDVLAGAYDMEGTARQLVHGLKYRGIREVAGLMAARMDPLRERHAFDVAVPVPLHRSRERSRGFNQAAEIVSALDWPAPPGRLVRTRRTDSQVGLRPGERRANITGAFAWRGPSLKGLRIAVVDDVITTGATANECARTLREHGARGVIVLAFARASYETLSATPPDD